jgi:hypothetical protein
MNNNTKYCMAHSLEATDEDSERMTQMLTGSCLMQIAGAAATYSVADDLAKGPSIAEQISTIEGMVTLTGRERILSDIADCWSTPGSVSPSVLLCASPVAVAA